MDGLAGLDALRDGWMRLEQGAVLPMQQFIWSRAGAATFTSDAELRVIALDDGNRTVAIAPLIYRTSSARLEWLGVAELYEPMDALYESEDVVPLLAAAIVDLELPIFLRRIPVASPLTDALARAYRSRGTSICRPDSAWPTITLDDAWADPESKFRAHRRAYLHRARRIAEELGTVESEVLTPTPENLPPRLEEAIAVEASSWKGRTGTALELDPIRGAFYRQYAAAAAAQGTLRLCFLRIDGRAIAMQLAVEFADAFWLLKIGYDEAFAACSPGNLLIRETISATAQRHVGSIAFLGAVEPWKEEWTHEQDPCVVLRGYPSGRRGLRRLTTDLAGAGRRRLPLSGRTDREARARDRGDHG